MRAQNISFTNADYGNLILAYVNVGRLEEAEGVLQDMRARNLQPELSTYNTLLDGYGRQGRYEEAESVLADMKQVGRAPTWLLIKTSEFDMSTWSTSFTASLWELFRFSLSIFSTPVGETEPFTQICPSCQNLDL